MAPLIDITYSVFSGPVRDSSGRIVATPGDTVRCILRLKNTGSKKLDVWYGIYNGANRIQYDFITLYAGSSASINASVKMPNSRLDLIYRCGYFSGSSKYHSDESKFPPIHPVARTGSIYVSSSPSGAAVHIKGDHKGNTPVKVSLIPGRYTVTVRKYGYVQESRSIQVIAGRQDSFSTVLKVEPTKGWIKFYSTPTGANIAIGTAYQGTTPKTVQVNPGYYAVALGLTGYKLKNGSISIKAGETKVFSGVLEKKSAEGQIAFGSTPVGARIYVNETYRGVTGVGLYKYVTLPVDTYNAKLMLEGYQDATATVRVGEGLTTYYTPALKSKITTMKMRVESVSFSGTTVSGASIYVDDKPTGINTPGMIELSIPGPHKIEVKKTIPIIGALAVSKPVVVTGLIAGAIMTKVCSFIDIYKSCNLNPVPEMPPPTPINIVGASATGLVKLGMKFVPGCTIFGRRCSGDIYPLTLKVNIAGQDYHLGMSGAGPMDFDFTPNIRNLIMSGKIVRNATEFKFAVKYPTMVKIDPFSGKKETVYSKPLSVTIPLGGGTPLPIICMPSISKFTTPGELQLKMPAPGDLTAKPTLDITKFPVSGDMAPVCKQNTGSASVPANLFPMELPLLINEKHIATLKTDRYGHVYSTDLKTALASWLSGLSPNSIIAQLTGPASPPYLMMTLKYPSKVTFKDAASTGVIDTYKSYRTPINLKKSDVDLLNICNIIKNTDLKYPDSLTVDMSIPGMPTLPGSAAIGMALGAVCAGATPLNLFTNATADISVGGAPPVSVPITGGLMQYNLATDPSWLQYVYEGMKSLMLSVTIPKKINADTLQVMETETITKSMGVDTGGGVIPGGCTEDLMHTCPDGTVITLQKCANGVLYPTGEVCLPSPGPLPPGPTPGGCTADVTHACPDGTVITQATCDLATGMLYPTGESCPATPPPTPGGCTADVTHACADGSVITIQKCINGVLIPTGATCPTTPPGPGPRPTGTKSVFATTPLLSRVGKRVQIVGLVFCGTSKVGGEKTWISINGELLTTANTRNGKVTAEWTPVVPGLYTICITVPASSACNASANGCTMMQVVSELSQEEIEAAEEEFEKAKERIGEEMERI